MKKPNLVVIEKNKYSFYENGEFDLAVESDNMSKEHLEYYRQNPKRIFQDLEDE